MAEKVGSAYWDLDLDDAKFQKGVKGSRGAIDKLSSSFEPAVALSQTVAKGVGIVAVSLGGLAIQGLIAAGNMEAAEAGFKTLLGSAEAASATMHRIKQEAKATPFKIEGLTQSTQLLAAVTKDGDKAVDIILDLGESLAAVGKGDVELKTLAINLQAIGATGRATMQDIRQFSTAGIPIFELLQKQTGLTGDELGKFISDGKVSFELLTEMFRNATDEGGRFYGAFKDQAGGLNQVWSNLVDSVSIELMEFVKTTGLMDFSKAAIQQVTAAIGKFGEKIKEAGGYAAYTRRTISDNAVLFRTLAGILFALLLPAFASMAGGLAAIAIPFTVLTGTGAMLGNLLPIIVGKMGGMNAVMELGRQLLEKLGAAWTTVQGYILAFRDSLVATWYVWSSVLLPALEQLRQMFVEQVVPALALLWRMLVEYLIPAVMGLLRILSPLLIPILQLLGRVLATTVVVAILAVIGVLVLLSQIIINVAEGFKRYGLGIKWLVVNTAEQIGLLAGRVGQAVVEIGESIKRLIGKFQGILPAVKESVSGAGQAIINGFKSGFDWLNNKINAAKNSLDKINPFHRESPSLIDWITKGSNQIVKTYGEMFGQIDDMSVHSRTGLIMNAPSISATPTSSAAAPVYNISLNPSGIVARSRSEWREIMADGISALNEALAAQGKPLISNLE